MYHPSRKCNHKSRNHNQPSMTYVLCTWQVGPHLLVRLGSDLITPTNIFASTENRRKAGLLGSLIHTKVIQLTWNYIWEQSPGGLGHTLWLPAHGDPTKQARDYGIRDLVGNNQVNMVRRVLILESHGGDWTDVSLLILWPRSENDQTTMTMNNDKTRAWLALCHADLWQH